MFTEGSWKRIGVSNYNYEAIPEFNDRVFDHFATKFGHQNKRETKGASLPTGSPWTSGPWRSFWA